MAAAPRRWWRSLYFWVLVAIAAGALTGWLFPAFGQSLKPLGDGFIKLVKMIITPVIFLTVVTGIAGMSDLKAFGRVGARAMAYFLTFSTLALVIGLVVANVVQPGTGLNIDPPTLDTSRVSTFASQAEEQSVSGFLLNIIPTTMVSAFTAGRNPAGAVGRDPVRHRARAASARAASRAGRDAEDADRDRLPARPYPDVRGAGRRVRGDGLSPSANMGSARSPISSP